MAQVIVYTADGKFSTTANDEKRPGETRSELERLLAGDIAGREGYKGGSLTKPDVSAPDAQEQQNLNTVTDNNAVVQTLEQTRVLLPYLTKLDPKRGEALIRAYTEGFNETGKAEFALASMRAAPEYDEMFTGIKRADGSLRLTEAQYLQNKEAVIIHLNEAGLGGYAKTKIDALFPTLLEGNVSPNEFKTRLDTVRKGITNLDAELKQNVMSQYQQYFESELGEALPVTEEVLLAIAIDPEATSDIIGERLKVANIGARFQISTGEELTADQATMFISAGLAPTKATPLFETAAARALTASRLARRFNRDQQYTAVQLAQAEVTKDFETQQELSRLSAQAASESAVAMGAAKTKGGAVTGLTEG